MPTPLLAGEKVSFRAVLEGSTTRFYTTSATCFLHPAVCRRLETGPSLPQALKGAGRRGRETSTLCGVIRHSHLLNKLLVVQDLFWSLWFWGVVLPLVLPKQHVSKRKAGWSGVTLSVNNPIFFLEYNWKGRKSICTAVPRSLVCPGLSDGAAFCSLQAHTKTLQAFALSFVPCCEERKKYFRSASLFVPLLICCNWEL